MSSGVLLSSSGLIQPFDVAAALLFLNASTNVRMSPYWASMALWSSYSAGRDSCHLALNFPGSASSQMSCVHGFGGGGVSTGGVSVGGVSPAAGGGGVLSAGGGGASGAAGGGVSSGMVLRLEG